MEQQLDILRTPSMQLALGLIGLATGFCAFVFGAVGMLVALVLGVVLLTTARSRAFGAGLIIGLVTYWVLITLWFAQLGMFSE